MAYQREPPFWDLGYRGLSSFDRLLVLYTFVHDPYAVQEYDCRHIATSGWPLPNPHISRPTKWPSKRKLANTKFQDPFCTCSSSRDLFAVAELSKTVRGPPAPFAERSLCRRAAVSWHQAAWQPGSGASWCWQKLNSGHSLKLGQICCLQLTPSAQLFSLPSRSLRCILVHCKLPTNGQRGAA